jgi:hypothetical protein
MRKRILLASAAVLLLGCPAATPGASEPTGEAAAVLVSYRHSMTMDPGMGGTSTLTTVRGDGAVEREEATERASAALRCAPLAAEKLAELETLVLTARDAGFQPAYTTSTLPTPNANYSVDLWFTLGGGSAQEIHVAGFADMPPELSALAQWLDANVAGCETEPAGGTAAPGDPVEETAERCLVSDPADIYRSTRLCLEEEEGRFMLSTSQVVPDATLSETYEGSVEAGPEGLVLRAEQARSQTVNEQLGTVSQGAAGAAQAEWRLTENAGGTFTLRTADGTIVELRTE